MTQEILDDIFGEIGGMSYLPYTGTYLGDPCVDLGDIITVNGNDVPVMSINQDHDGGLTTTIGCYGHTEEEENNPNAGNVIKMCRIKIADFTAVTYDITTPVNIYFEQIRTGDQYQYGYRVSVSGNKLVVNEYGSNNIAVIDITDYSFKEIESPFAGKMFYIGDIQNGYLFLSNSDNENNDQYILDVDSAELMRLEAYGWTTSTSSPAHTLYNRKRIGTRFAGSRIHSLNKNYLYPFYHIMLTKNNLDSPVTKTADKTMKITYTIKEV